MEKRDQSQMGVTSTLLAILFVCLIGAIVRWTVNRYKRLQLLKQYGIPGPKPNFFDGNFYELDAEKRPYNAITKWLKQYGNVFGYYLGELPHVVINDIEMLKQIFIKDFHVFSNRPNLIINLKPLDKTLIFLKSQRWKDVRSILTPSFSSAKIKLMAHIVDKKVDITLNEVAKKVEKNEMFDMYELIQGLTLDVIADCALAMKTHCQENPNDKFLIAVRDYFCYSDNKAVEWAIMFPFIASIMEFIAKYMRVGQMNKLIVDNLNTVIKARQEDPSLKTMDMLQLMLDVRKENSTGITDEEIVANAFIFLLAGFETSGTALSCTFYLLITHPEIQKRLQQEIDAAEDSSYTTVQNLQYLDQVFHESLRLYPPVTGFVSRHCDEDYNVGKYTIPKGTIAIAPVWDIHHDPELWPDPWKFDPDRFSPEKKGSMNNMAYLPFGAGPRSCIGGRFAQLEAKLAIFRLLKNFTFETCEKTEDPLKLTVPTVFINPANGIWLRAVPRDTDGLN